MAHPNYKHMHLLIFLGLYKGKKERLAIDHNTLLSVELLLIIINCMFIYIKRVKFKD